MKSHFMQSLSLVAAVLPLTAIACNDHAARQYYPRQDSSATSATGSGTTTGPTAAPSVSTSYTYSLASSESTAVPLSSITASATTNSAELPTLATTYTAGAEPTLIEGAPPLPALNLNIASYPPLDRTPPTDSDEVKQWKAEVANSGITIPNIKPNVAGGCPTNPEAVANAGENGNCWWTCGGCTRDTDITTCPTKGSWGLTFDDGPAPYTPALLKYLDEKDLKATFFTVGSRVLSYPAMLQAEYMEGHQVAGHTWAHPALTTLENDQIIAELGWTRKVMQEVIGVTPNMFRPPYGDIDDRVRAIATAMGMYSVMWTRISPTQTFDTHDFDIQSGLFTPEGVLQSWEFILGNASKLDTGFIALEHDLYQQTVEIASGYILPDAIAQGFDITPIVNCINQPLANAYIETNDNSTNPPAASGSGVVTLSSGAAGSAQETGASGSGDSDSAISKGMSAVLGMTLISLVAAIAILV
ncbi:hypothetical protein CPB85DRAFT_1266590 [Mucidula mucida]|nr:hypothetical protein CPB85DRAFT_1266590 [Mucidula mucida]